MAKGDPSQGGGMGYFPGIYQSALAQSAQDYDSIMSQYKDLASETKSSASSAGNQKFNPISPTFANYEGGSDFSDLENFSKTGGFSEGDVGNIRARGIAPIRSIYSSAQQGLNRQKALSGGYSPNYGAASAKMARDSSDLISKTSTDVNAGLAEMIQRGKLSAASTLAPLRAQETARKQDVTSQNASVANRIAETNAQMKLATEQSNQSSRDNSFNKILQAIQGQQSLYGTTPALINTLGNQTLNAANIANNLPPIQRGATAVPNLGGNGIMGGISAGANRGSITTPIQAPIQRKLAPAAPPPPNLWGPSVRANQLASQRFSGPTFGGG